MSPDFQINTQNLSLKIIEASGAQEFSQLVKSSASLLPWLDWCHSEFSIIEA
ncbi:ribosomal-protein-serine acetyltransferase, partial [Vibrio splendidus]